MKASRALRLGLCVIVFPSILFVGAAPAVAEEAQERIEQLQREHYWVTKELWRIENLREDEADYDQRLERLDRERNTLLRIMPERLDLEQSMDVLLSGADKRGIELEAGEPTIVNHGAYTAATWTVRLVGDSEAVESLVRRSRTTPGSPFLWTEIKEEGTARRFEVTTFAVPLQEITPRRCSIPEPAADASAAETDLRRRVISLCAQLHTTDPEIRRKIERHDALERSIGTVNDLMSEILPSEEPFTDDDIRELEKMLEEENTD